VKKKWGNRGCLGCCFYAAVVADFKLLLLQFLGCCCCCLCCSKKGREEESLGSLDEERERVLSNEIVLFIPPLFIATFLP